MKHLRFSIVGLMTAVLTSACVLAVVRHGRDFTCQIILTLVMAVFFLVPLVGLPARRFRAFCLGFVLFGWGYGILWMSPFGRFLPTTAFLEARYLQETVHNYFDVDGEALREHSRILLHRASHALVALVVAVMGGSAFHLLAGRKIDDDPVIDSLAGRLLNPDHAGRIRDDAPRN